MLRTVIGEGGELNGERVVVIAQVKTVAGNHGGVGDLIAVGTGGWVYMLAVQGESRQTDGRIPSDLPDT